MMLIITACDHRILLDIFQKRGAIKAIKNKIRNLTYTPDPLPELTV
jgi:hypothetical protein